MGMGTAFAGIVRAPMTSVLMIFEMTQDYSVIVPLMISSLISFFVLHASNTRRSTKLLQFRMAYTCRPAIRVELASDR